MRLGSATDGPWENCSRLAIDLARSQGNTEVVAAHRNLTYIVHRRRYPELPGYDLLTVMRQDETDRHPGWRHMQAIKDRLAPDGTERFAIEVLPPRRYIVDNADLWHIWVYPPGVELGFGFHPDQDGGGLRI